MNVRIREISTNHVVIEENTIFDDNIHYLHILFNEGEGLPEHIQSSDVYVIVLSGILSIALNEQDICEYTFGNLLKIAVNIKINASNLHDHPLEFIIVKAP